MFNLINQKSKIYRSDNEDLFWQVVEKLPHKKLSMALLFL
jgi:hypothetical protein